MRILTNGQLLKTKIVATVGRKRGVMEEDEDGNERRDVIHNPKEVIVDRVVEYGELLEWLIRAGVDVIRLNMSFAPPRKKGGGEYGEGAREVLEWLRKHKDGLAKWVVVLGDLPGPKIRLGLGNEKIETTEEGELLLDFVEKDRLSQTPNGANVLINDEPFCHPSSEATVDGYRDIDKFIDEKKARKEDVIFLIGDGEVRLKAESSANGIVRCLVVKGGTIRGKPGFTIKKYPVEVRPFLDADRVALNFLLEHGEGVVAYIGVSFVNTPDDIINIKMRVEKHLFDKYVEKDWKEEFDNYIEKRLKEKYGEEASNKNIEHLSPQEIEEVTQRAIRKLRQKARRYAPHIIAKFETRQACENKEGEDDCIDQILDVADGAMVARGDLGLQHDPQEVPAIQKRIIRKCNLRGKPVITATQMLDSMENNSEPTRAEANDVFNAIQDGSDAVMLSGETSTGKYPSQAVTMMTLIADEAERYYRNRFPGKAFERRLQTFMDETDESSKETFKRLTRLRGKTAAEYQEARNDDDANDPDASSEEKEKKRWKAQWYEEKRKRSEKQKITDRISESACLLSEARDNKAEDNSSERNGEGRNRQGDYEAIVAPTTSGRTARMMARFRPNVPIIGVAHDETNARKMILSFGVYPLCIGEGQKTVEKVFSDACKEAIKEEHYLLWDNKFRLLKVGDVVISTSGTPLMRIGATNLIQIKEITLEDIAITRETS